MLLSADTKVRLALDRAAVQESFRTKDNDGHLHVSATPITKANVCPYFGREIVDWRDLGLNPDRVYKLYRHPEELQKAAKSFNGKPLLFGHREVSAEAHDHENTVGSNTGTYWDPPYLMGALDVWAGPAIEKIENGEAAELSAAYRYRADMTPGRTPEGEPYDGVMRDIDGNHVALVPRGRAGRDVVVRDSALWAFTKDPNMNKANLSPAAALVRGALLVTMKSRLAQDAAIDFDPVLKGVNAKNIRASVPAIVLGVQKAARGKLAQDADLNDLPEIVEALVEAAPADVAAEIQDALGSNGDPPAEDDDDAELRAMLKAKGLSDEEIDRICAMGSAPDTATDEKDGDKDKKDDKAMDAATVDALIRKATKGMVPKAAMDREIASAEARAIAATTAHLNSISEARLRVAPYVGEIVLAMDSAEAVERQACDMLGIAHKGKHADALMTMIEAKGRPGDKSKAQPRVAQDAASVTGFNARYPNAARIGHAA